MPSLSPNAALAKIQYTAAVSAMQFALETERGLDFLNAWLHGAFDEIRRDWPEAPASVFMADEQGLPSPQNDLTKLGYTPSQIATLRRMMSSSGGG